MDMWGGGKPDEGNTANLYTPGNLHSYGVGRIHVCARRRACGQRMASHPDRIVCCFGTVETVLTILANPIAALISVPFQFNYDSDIGPADDGERATLNIQPVIPITLNEDWNVISRTIVPITWQDDIFPGAGDQFGVGDVLQSFFFSPSTPTAGGIIWGPGPVFRLPTATDNLLGAWGRVPSPCGRREGGPTAGWSTTSGRLPATTTGQT